MAKPEFNANVFFFFFFFITLFFLTFFFSCRTQSSQLTQTVLIQNGTLLLNSKNSSLTLLNIEMKFLELKILKSFIIIENHFNLKMQVEKNNFKTFNLFIYQNCSYIIESNSLQGLDFITSYDQCFVNISTFYLVPLTVDNALLMATIFNVSNSNFSLAFLTLRFMKFQLILILKF